MTRPSVKPSAHIEVVPATAEQMPVVANLIELYAHDFSEFHDLALGEDGRFGYNPLPLYWTDPNRHPFLVKMDGKLAGFVLVRKESSVWDMAEFFVVRGCRRRGIGTAIAHDVWRRFPGLWEVRVMHSNHAARHFWERAISGFTGEPIQPIRVERAGESWHVFSFESTPEKFNAPT
jgi:predicted acetyltransferase